MPAEVGSSMELIVIAAAGFLLLVLLVGQVRIGGRLRRIEKMVGVLHAAQRERDDERERSERPSNREQRRLFQMFLHEDPAREDLPKKEQFAAFRKWRSEKGLNWGGD